jgi:MoxR-like ATPase
VACFTPLAHLAQDLQIDVVHGAQLIVVGASVIGLGHTCCMTLDPTARPERGAEAATAPAEPVSHSPVSPVEQTRRLLLGQDYVADTRLATVVHLALQLKRPLFLEGEPGTGKTEIARTLAAALGRPLIRLQCYEGLDLAGAAYEWNYARQMMEIRLAGTVSSGSTGDADAADAADAPASRDELAARLFGERFLIKRALLQAIDPAQPIPPVLLIDELDRADEPFEAFLLEVLSDWQITIPEFGTVRAAQPPIVVLTSNRTREIHDAVKRRCLYHWVGFPDARREAEILARRLPEAPQALARQVVAFVQELRRLELYKLPGVAETLEWARALMVLGAREVDVPLVQHTLGLLLKYQDDIARVDGDEIQRLLQRVQVEAAAR